MALPVTRRLAEAVVGMLRGWPAHVAYAAGVMALLSTLQWPPATSPASSSAPPEATATSALAGKGMSVPRLELVPTFDEAAESLRSGRHAEAYGRFVSLADEGDVDAARIALVMHALGPRLFASQWDASAEQLQTWTRWSAAAAAEDRLRETLVTGPVGAVP